MDEGKDLMTALPTELFHMLLSWIPDQTIVTLRLVSKSWKQRTDSQDWIHRVFYAPVAPRERYKAHAVVNIIRERLPKWSKSLRYLCMSHEMVYAASFFGLEDLASTILRTYPPLEIVTLVDCFSKTRTQMFQEVCLCMSTMKLQELRLQLSWTQLNCLLPCLADLKNLHTLELHLKYPKEHEMKDAYEGVTALPVGEDTDADNRTSSPAGVVLTSLRYLTVGFVTYKFMCLRIDDRNATAVMLKGLHRPLIGILLAARNMIQLKMTNSECHSFRKQSCYRGIEEQFTAYTDAFAAIGLTHASLQRVVFENICLDYSVFKHAKGIELVNCEPLRQPAATIDDLAVEKLIIHWKAFLKFSKAEVDVKSKDGQTTRKIWDDHAEFAGYKPHAADIFLSPKLRSILVHDDSGVAMHKFLETLRELKQPILSMKVMNIHARYKARGDDQYFTDTDFDRLIWAFPNLTKLLICDGKFTGIDDLETVRTRLRTNLKFLNDLHIGKSEIGPRHTRSCAVCGVCL